MADAIVSANPRSDKPTYIYGLVDPRTNQIRYVGKTVLSPERRVAVHIWRARSAPKKRHSMAWIASLHADGLRPEVLEIEIVPPGGDWVEAEQFWIAYWRFVGADLCNHTIGGEGQTGYRQPAETVAKRVAKTSGENHHRFGKPMPPHVQEALEVGKRRLLSDPDRARAFHKARLARVTPEGRARSIQALQQTSRDPERLAARERKRLASCQTESHRATVSAQSKELWATKRDEIIAAQNAGKGPEWSRRQSDAKRAQWADPNSPMRAAMAQRRRLSEADQQDILNRLSRGESQSSIAANYRIDPSLVSRIKSGQRRYK